MTKEVEMDESKSQADEPKEGQRRFSQEQYDMLKRCSDKKDMTEWNRWRRRHKEEDVCLEEADFSRWHLESANLGTLRMTHTDTGEDVFAGVYLNGAIFKQAHLEHADLQFAHLEGADLRWAHLEDSALMDAGLKGARMWFAHLQGADLAYADLRGTEVMQANVDQATSLWECKVNRRANFLGVALGIAKIDPGTKQLLEYNIRRKNWEKWYPEHRLLRWPVRWFWCLSDYGLSTWRVIIWFFGLALGFAAIYANCACWWPPGIVSNLVVEPHVPLWHYFLLVLLRPLYFSVVTMTTLGFGDMHANATSIWGHILLTFQVILGYVLLGALVTRFAVLFTAGGPAGKFADEKEEKTKRTKSE